MNCSGNTLCAFSKYFEVYIILSLPLLLQPLLLCYKFYALELHVKPPAANLCQKFLPLPLSVQLDGNQSYFPFITDLHKPFSQNKNV